MANIPIFEFILQKYHPARSFNDPGVITLTTADILNEITAHAGFIQDVDHAFVYNWMLENGFNNDTIGDLQFVWLLVEIDDRGFTVSSNSSSPQNLSE